MNTFSYTLNQGHHAGSTVQLKADERCEDTFDIYLNGVEYSGSGLDGAGVNTRLCDYDMMPEYSYSPDSDFVAVISFLGLTEFAQLLAELNVELS
jgi:hypothetical protein